MSQTTTDLIQAAITEKLAATLIDELTPAKLKSLINEVLTKKTGDSWYSKPFLEELVNGQIKRIIQEEVQKRLSAKEDVIRAAVSGVITDKVIENLAKAVEVDLKDGMLVKVMFKKDSD